MTTLLEPAVDALSSLRASTPVDRRQILGEPVSLG